MKIELLKQGEVYYLKTYFGFIPMYWMDGYDSGWSLFKYQISLERANKLMHDWQCYSQSEKMRKAEKIQSIKTIQI